MVLALAMLDRYRTGPHQVKGKQMKLHELQNVFEMANIGPEVHKFGINVKLNLLQPGDKQIEHQPRVKVKKKGASKDFSIKLIDPMDPVDSLVGDYFELGLSTKQYNELFDNIKKHRAAFLNFWYDSDMDQGELRALMDEIDAGKEVEVIKNPSQA